MTVDDIYSKIATHMIQGMMFHEQLANYFDFLGLKGYKKCHEYHFFEESKAYRSVCRYFINHHNKLIKTAPVDDPHTIPDSWYKYSRHSVDVNTRKNAVENAIEIWVKWETDTKILYEQSYDELLDIKEAASAFKIKELIEDVDRELEHAECKYIKLKAIDFDMSVIVPEQNILYKEYCRKLKRFSDNICKFGGDSNGED